MMRIEIIANRSVEDNLLEAFREEGVGKFYTKYPSVLGIGSTGPRMGDAIWPEENFALVIWCEEAELKGLERAVGAVKKQFPDEGIKLFKPGSPAVQSGASITVTAPVLEIIRNPLAAPLPEGPPPPQSPGFYGPEAENS
jgi:hypothetical protein